MENVFWNSLPKASSNENSALSTIYPEVSTESLFVHEVSPYVDSDGKSEADNLMIDHPLWLCIGVFICFVLLVTALLVVQLKEKSSYDIASQELTHTYNALAQSLERVDV